MISRERLSLILLTLFVLSSIGSAWPWPRSLKDLSIEGFLLRRQNDPKKDAASSSTTASAKGTAKGSAKGTAKESAKASKTQANTSKTDAKASGTAAKTGARTSKTAAASGTSAAVTSVSDVLPPGGVNMITPSALAQSTYYKIGDYVSFAWNYTSLSIKPSKIDVLVSCSANSATYTLANNQSFKATDSVVWDTHPDETGTAPLLTETYTLVVYDAASEITSVAGAGRLGTDKDFIFGMYLPQKYTPRSEWKCAVCNSALSDTERQAIKFMFGMCAVTVLSFTWFVSGFSGLLQA